MHRHLTDRPARTIVRGLFDATRVGSARVLRSSVVGAFVLVFAATTLAGVAQAGAEIRVETRNMYLGADLTPVVTAPPAEFLAEAVAALLQVAANNFPERAERLAQEIVDKDPHVVGIQEAFDFTFDPGIGPLNGAPPFRDMLADLLAALALKGASYDVVASGKNIDITVPGVPVPGLGVGAVGVVDRDVILVRSDLVASAVDYSGACAKPSQSGTAGVPPSGCLFDVVAPTPLGDVERGWVGVDVTVDGKAFRVVNTHLEVMTPDAGNPLSSIVQAAQANQLLNTVLFTTPPGRSLLVVGDINSSPDDPVIPPPPFLIVPPYSQFVLAGLIDMWNLRPGKSNGYTCCQLSDLSNPADISDERIDVIFGAELPVKVKANVVGGDPVDSKTIPSDLWPSDHLGVVAEIEY